MTRTVIRYFMNILQKFRMNNDHLIPVALFTSEEISRAPSTEGAGAGDGRRRCDKDVMMESS